MTKGRKDAGWWRWGRDVTTHTVAGVLTIALLAVVGWLNESVGRWLFGPVSIFGWGLLLMLLLACTAGYQMARWRILKMVAPDETIVRPAVPTFQPDALEEKVIRLLRYADGWVSFEIMAKKLEVGSRQDLSQSLRRLMNAYWVEQPNDNIYKNEGGKVYRLASKGLAFAREKGLETSTTIKRRLESEGSTA